MNQVIALIISRAKLHTDTRRKMVFGAAGNLLIKVSAKLIGFVTTLFLARLLGVEGLGIYYYALTVVTTISVFGVPSLSNLIIQKTAAFLSQQSWSLMRGFLARLRLIGVALAILYAIVAFSVSWVLIEAEKMQLLWTLVIAFTMLPLVAALYINTNTLQGLGFVVLGQVPMFIIRSVVFLALVGTIHFVVGVEMSARDVMVAQALGALITLLVSGWLLRHRIPPHARTAPPAYDMKNWLHGAFPYLVAGILSQVNAQVDVLLLGSIASPEAVGIYRPAAMIAMLILFGAGAVEIAIRPTIASRYALGRDKGFQRLSAYSAWAGFVFAMCTTAFVLVFGKWILLIFGPDFIAGATALTILCVGRVVFAVMGIPTVFLNMTGNQSATMRGMIVAVASNLLLNFVLIPRYGVNGAAVASATSLILLNLHNMIVVRRLLAVDTTIFGLRSRLVHGT